MTGELVAAAVAWLAGAGALAVVVGRLLAARGRVAHLEWLLADSVTTLTESLRTERMVTSQRATVWVDGLTDREQQVVDAAVEALPVDLLTGVSR